MAIYILQPSLLGECCDCNGRSSPCDTCGGGNGFQCRTEGGTAQMCGQQGYVSTTPANYYKTTSLNGSFAYCEHLTQGFDCGAGVNGESRHKYVYEGSNTTDCTTTTRGITVKITDEILPCCSPCSFSPSGPITTLTVDPPPAFSSFATITTQEASKTYEYSNDCVICAGFCTFEGTVTLSLSDQDTESDAITRLINNSPWTDWAFTENCSARYQIRTFSSFSYIAAQWRFDRGGLRPSANYRLTVNVYRRVYGGSDWTLYQTVTLDEQSSGSGHITTDPVDVPNSRGYETYADLANATIHQI